MHETQSRLTDGTGLDLIARLDRTGPGPAPDVCVSQTKHDPQVTTAMARFSVSRCFCRSPDHGPCMYSRRQVRVFGNNTVDDGPNERWSDRNDERLSSNRTRRFQDYHSHARAEAISDGALWVLANDHLPIGTRRNSARPRSPSFRRHSDGRPPPGSMSLLLRTGSDGRI